MMLAGKPIGRTDSERLVISTHYIKPRPCVKEKTEAAVLRFCLFFQQFYEKQSTFSDSETPYIIVNRKVMRAGADIEIFRYL